MKKLLILLSVLCILPTYAQRYTGWGRGIDLHDVYSINWIDFLFVGGIIIILLIGFVLTIFSKINNWLIFSSKGIVPFMIFKRFRQFSITTVTDKESGEVTKLCTFTNILGNKTFVAFSPYLGELNLGTLKKKKAEFYVTWEKKGCYFLCTKETETYKKENDDPYSGYHMFEDSLESLLLLLNVNHEFNNFIFK